MLNFFCESLIPQSKQMPHQIQSSATLDASRLCPRLKLKMKQIVIRISLKITSDQSQSRRSFRRHPSRTHHFWKRWGHWLGKTFLGHGHCLEWTENNYRHSQTPTVKPCIHSQRILRITNIILKMEPEYDLNKRLKLLPAHARIM